MPDIKTAFEKALTKTQVHLAQPFPQDWDDEGATASIETITTNNEAPLVKAHFSVTNNVTRETFDHIKNNPGQTRTQAVQALEKRGFQPKSTTSLLSQMVRQDLIREVRGLLYAQEAEYRPLKSAKTIRSNTPVKAALPKKATAKAVPHEALTPAVQVNSAWDADVLLNQLSIKQARALYDELRKIFGGAA